MARGMQVEIASSAPLETGADLLCVGLFEGEELPAGLASARGAADAEGKLKRLTILRPEHPERVLMVGLGAREELSVERARVAAAQAVGQARRYRATTLAWDCPAGDGVAEGLPAGLVEGTLLADWRFDRFKGSGEEGGEPEARIETLTLHGAADAEQSVAVARVAAEAANRARELQSLPANVADPAYLAERAEGIAATHERVSAEIMDRARLEREGMGGLLAVTAGSAKEPRLIVLRHAAPEGSPKLGLVGKAVTFDTGGISLKPAASMPEMKMDMSGGAAVLEAVAAIAELELPIELLAVVPSVENMPSGTATRPGDIITQLNGKTVEVNNTDAEGRLILADALTWCARQGAGRIVDLATLTGAVVVALGSTYAGLMANDDELAAAVAGAGEAVGELAWRLPMHAEYRKLMDGTVADLSNTGAKRKAGTISAAAFLEEFVEGAKWAHLDIAGTSWDVGREYVGKGATGFGVRLLVELARRLAAEGQSGTR